ncbi:MAG: penicillin-binding protein 2 [Actinobacteria bacterium]|nr:penicillin-binding protein 2 [Actinomycetota bacterium]
MKPIETTQKRLAFFTIFMVIVFSIILVRLWFLQVIEGETYAKIAEENRIRLVAIPALRGVIYDRNKNILVDNKASLAVSFTPGKKRGDIEVINRLSQILGMSVSEIEAKINENKSDPLAPKIIKSNLDEKTVAFIKEHQIDLPGVNIETESVRDYPNGITAAQILGYLGEISESELKEREYSSYVLGDIIGKTGIEKQYESFLAGEKGGQQLEVDASGSPIRILSNKDPVPGHSVMLTIDKSIQQAAEQALIDAINVSHKQKYPKAQAGAAVVLDVRNGEVIALASYPTYDPTYFSGGRISFAKWQSLNSKSSNYPLRNRATMSSYPPGSTFKPIVGLGALAEGITTPTKGYLCTGRWYGLGQKWAKNCWKKGGHGKLNFNRGVIVSCDTVFYEIAYRVQKKGGEKLQLWARNFGLGSETGVDLPFEVSGRVPDKAWKKEWNKNNPRNQAWVPGDTVNMAIGQGDLLVTPLQLTNAYAAIANGGTLFKPKIAKNVLSFEGQVSYQFKPEEIKKLPLNSATLKVMQDDLEKVTKEGTATNAFVDFPIPVAGKTGTAQVKGKDDFAWFVGYAPANKPEYAVLVMVEQGGHGASVAAPAVRQIIGTIYNVDIAKLKAPSFVDFSR